MRKLSYRPYFLLALFLLSTLSLPIQITEKMRSLAVSSFSPSWRGFDLLREKTSMLLTLPLTTGDSPSSSQIRQIEELTQENYLLSAQVASMREWLLNEERLKEEIERYQLLLSQKSRESFFKRRGAELKERLELQLCFLPAQVIFRQPTTWSSSVWINVGERDNKRLGVEVVCKNSPVLVGSSVIGVIEYVGASQSRVRLITDALLTISVRAVRGETQNRHLIEAIETLLFSLKTRVDVFDAQEAQQTAFRLLSHIKEKLLSQTGDLYLAKGELKGSSAPLWRSRSPRLKGCGFNYDFPDLEGPARDLRSGEPYGSSGKGSPIQLLQPGDLLVTTGLDGLFPPGLEIARVSVVDLLKEGASSYEIEASPVAGDLDTLSHVLVLPPYTIY